MALTTFLCEKDWLFIPWSSSEVTEDYGISWTLSVKIFWFNLILTLKVAKFRRFSLFLASSNSAWRQPVEAGAGGWLQLDPGHTGDGSGAVPHAHSSAELLAIVGNFIWNIKLHWEGNSCITFQTNQQVNTDGRHWCRAQRTFSQKSQACVFPQFSEFFITSSWFFRGSSCSFPLDSLLPSAGAGQKLFSLS